jgi:hypothetical protein
MKIFEILIPILLIVMGITSCLATWIPALAPHWKGSKEPMPPLSRFGFGLFFICLGLIALLDDLISKIFIHSLAITAASGFALIGISEALAARKQLQNSYRLLSERGMTKDRTLILSFIFLGILFLGIFLWLLSPK